MTSKKLGAIALWLACATPAFAAEDQEVWITVGTDALEPVRASLLRKGVTLPAVAHEKDGVAVMHVRESQLDMLSEVIHSKLNRCAGYMAHESEAQARAALTPREMAPALVSYSIDNPTAAKSLVGGITESGIRGTITTLSAFPSRHYKLSEGQQAATWLKERWTTLASGRSDISVALYTHTSTVSPQPSVILTIKGTSTTSNEEIVLGGHLDSINSAGSSAKAPGADDDASGVASLTEVIRVIVAKGYRPARTVKFMAYAGEEGGLRGSKDIAAKYKSTGVNVVGVLQLDMTNYRGSTTPIVLVSDYTTAAQNTFLTNLVKQYLPSTVTVGTTRCGYACSDHASWYNQGYPASIPFEARLGEDNPAIHTANDTLAQSAGSAQNSVPFAQLAAAYVAELAKGTVTTP
ncbi:M20/M25/M40 family metallo-hydrolase [Stigmatella erecta]|uniref:Leucyl aminopeptidase n=1 Tax=Stigmatella erecta TaxID=83460 RepID=A0A1I0K096_9BACT|nr:M20/M25/M40 family metallo-hydrolase [Stigmatella erecta]SEU16741.1 leucyl aminopeptidase [Stigmatella erecta]